VSLSESPRLPETQIRLLLTLANLGQATAPDLARALAGVEPEVTANTAQALLLRLQAAGLVESTRTIQNRLWKLTHPESLFDLLRSDARRILTSRYASDSLALRALLVEVEQLLAETPPKLQKKA
jgi:predicted ArsR family transcriptional regulator